jgi:hypothetical protein
LIFFSVMVLLGRPFVAYRLAAQSSFAGNPQKVNSLLQRLIKKKEDHREPAAMSFAEANPSPGRIRLPVKFIERFLPNSRHLFLSPFSANKPLSTLPYPIGLLVSRLRI